jgi:integrase/recombinase XerD
MSDCTMPDDGREQAVIDLWRQGHLHSGTIQIYLQWVRRFRAFCAKRQLDGVEQLTREGVRSFLRSYIGPRLKKRASAPSSRGVAQNALHAWSCALRALGVAVRPWRVKHEAPPLSPLLAEYRRFRKAHSGVSDRTLWRDVETARVFLGLLRSRKQSVEQIGLKDVDLFVRNTAAKFSISTVADTCSSLRAFLRFLHVTGRLASDLANGVMGPRFGAFRRPREPCRGTMCDGS